MTLCAVEQQKQKDKGNDERRERFWTKTWEAVESMRTFDKNGEKGKPLSRAKDQICREAVATSAITAHTSAMMMIALIMLVPT